MKKEEKVLNYYVMCNKLKNIIRTGWLNWNVKRERLESVAEHVFGVQMLAIAINSEYNYDIDITKVIYMLAIHEIGETIIGDLTRFQISEEDKKKIEHNAVGKVLEPLKDKEYIKNLFIEFDEGKTKEAKFAYQCDKLECDLQSKLYDQENCVNLKDQENNSTKDHPLVKKLLDEGNSWSSMWLKFSQESYPYDENFKSISDYATENEI